MKTLSPTSRFARLAALVTVAGALALTASPAFAQDDEATTQEERAKALVEQQAMLRAELEAARREHQDLQNQYERARAVVVSLEQRLQEARLSGVAEEEMEPVARELVRQRELTENLHGQLDQMSQLVAQRMAMSEELANRARAEREQAERRRQQDEIRRTQDAQRQAMAQAERTIEQARQLAAREDVEALREALAQTEIDKLQLRYAALQQQAERAGLLAERGLSTPQELIQIESEANMALAELRQAELRRLLEEVERQQQAFRERSETDRPQAVPQEAREGALQTAFFRGYLDTVQQYARLSSDPSNAAVAGVVTAADLLREAGPEASIEYFEPILRDIQRARQTDPSMGAAEAAVRLQLAEAYQSVGRHTKALEVLRGLIVPAQAADTAPRE